MFNLFKIKPNFKEIEAKVKKGLEINKLIEENLHTIDNEETKEDKKLKYLETLFLKIDKFFYLKNTNSLFINTDLGVRRVDITRNSSYDYTSEISIIYYYPTSSNCTPQEQKLLFGANYFKERKTNNIYVEMTNFEPNDLSQTEMLNAIIELADKAKDNIILDYVNLEV